MSGIFDDFLTRCVRDCVEGEPATERPHECIPVPVIIATDWDTGPSSVRDATACVICGKEMVPEPETTEAPHSHYCVRCGSTWQHVDADCEAPRYEALRTIVGDYDCPMCVEGR